jgi:Protein of unknown function (DUF1344)
MKKLVIAAGAAGLLAVSSIAALAAQAMGTITSIDATSGAVTLSDGNTYALPQTVAASSLKVGESVNITYAADAATGKMTASAVLPSSG